MKLIWAEINLQSIKSNFNKVKKLISDNTEVMAVVKADAYGNGAVVVSKKLLECGAEMLGVATVEEALELRESGIKCKIMVLSGIERGEAELAVKNDLSVACYLPETIDELVKCSKKYNKPSGCHLKVDTGMTRLGISPEEIKNFFNSINLKDINLEGVFTHLSSADEKEDNATAKQIKQFLKAIQILEQLNISFSYQHIANSAGIQRYPESHFNLVRPGIMLYGSGDICGVGVEPVMKLKTKIIQIKKVKKGTPVSYGETFITDKDSTLAILPIGYADGYSRKLSNSSKVSINGDLAPVIGRVCMNLTIVDISGMENVKVGDEVTLFGDEAVSIEDISNWSETITYEVMSLVGRRVPRTYI